MAEAKALAATHPAPGRGRLARGARRLGAGGCAAVAVVAILVVVAALAPVLAPHGPFEVAGETFLPPGTPGHLLGTDNLGQDTWSQLIYGTRVTLLVGFLAALICVAVGIVVGSVAGYLGGVADTVIMRVTEGFQVLPSFLVALVIVAITGSGVLKVILVIGFLAWPRTSRLMRGQFVSLREREFVQAARVIGVPAGKLIWSEILPNALPPVMAIASLEVANAILLQAGLDFIGLNDPNSLAWGSMLRIGGKFLQDGWWLSVFPGAAIFVVCIAFTTLGNKLTEIVDPRMRKR